MDVFLIARVRLSHNEGDEDRICHRAAALLPAGTSAGRRECRRVAAKLSGAGLAQILLSAGGEEADRAVEYDDTSGYPDAGDDCGHDYSD